MLFPIDHIALVKELTPTTMYDPAVSHALKLRTAWSSGNYYRFFQLYSGTPNFGTNLLDLFVDRERKAALKTLVKAYVHVMGGNLKG